MPLNSAQLAELVNRAKHKAPPRISPPMAAPVTHRPMRDRQPKPAPQAPSTTHSPSGQEKLQTDTPGVAATASAVPAVPASVSTPQSEAHDFPTGWELRRESWHFHRRFYAIFKRAMRRGEYSQLLAQIRRGLAEPLGEDCWRVTLPGSSRTLPVRATRWRLITILPKSWQPPAER